MIPQRPPGPVLTSADHTLLRALVYQRAGLVLEPGKEYFAELRLGALANDEGFADASHVMDALRTEESWGGLHRLVVESLAVCETSWFRDLHTWDALRTIWIPELLQRRAAARELRIWSAACASGQEPYSLAMMLREHFPQLFEWKITLLATDFSTTMLRRARDGEYSQIEMNRGLPAPLLVRYFRKDRQEWRLRDDVRAMVEFRELNLTGPWPVLPAVDLVLMRNVLIYFDTSTRRRVLRQLHGALAPDGGLVLGGGETTLTMDDSFEPMNQGRTVIHRPRQRTPQEANRWKAA
ncbi:MAG: protein-glutamate O-methyltransferase CheR [Candidatus Eisenbacteria bacterium]